MKLSVVFVILLATPVVELEHQTTAKDPDKCEDGLHGPRCLLQCNSGCKHRICERLSGNCSECENGYYGSTCIQKCGRNCRHLTCDQNSGHCSFRCNDGFFGSMCDQECRDCYVCKPDSGTCILTHPPWDFCSSAILISSSLGGLAIFAISVLLIYRFYKRKQTKKGIRPPIDPPVPLRRENTDDHYDLIKERIATAKYKSNSMSTIDNRRLELFNLSKPEESSQHLRGCKKPFRRKANSTSTPNDDHPSDHPPFCVGERHGIFELFNINPERTINDNFPPSGDNNLRESSTDTMSSTREDTVQVAQGNHQRGPQDGPRGSLHEEPHCCSQGVPQDGPRGSLHEEPQGCSQGVPQEVPLKGSQEGPRGGSEEIAGQNIPPGKSNRQKGYISAIFDQSEDDYFIQQYQVIAE